MKLAITGKGGVGKTTVTALLAHSFNQSGNKVIVVDADPDSNLAFLLGIHKDHALTPLSEMKSLIEDRVGMKPGSVGTYFKLNPKVDDIPEKFSTEIDGLKLLLLGTIRKAKGGCFCPENAFIKELMNHILIERDEIVMLDMEAGIEHLGRGTAEGVDSLLVIVEPSMLSISTAERIVNLGQQLNIRNIFTIGNKIKTPEDREFILEHISLPSAGFIPYYEEIQNLCITAGSFDLLSEDLVASLAGVMNFLKDKIILS